MIRTQPSSVPVDVPIQDELERVTCTAPIARSSFCRTDIHLVVDDWPVSAADLRKRANDDAKFEHSRAPSNRPLGTGASGDRGSSLPAVVQGRRPRPGDRRVGRPGSGGRGGPAPSARSRTHPSPLESTSQHEPMATPPQDAGQRWRAWQAASPGPFDGGSD